MTLPAKTIISRPLAAAAAVIVFAWLATTAFAQAERAAPSSLGGELFDLAAKLVVIITLLAIAAAAVFNITRKAALKEAESLAATRKEKLIEAELQRAKDQVRIKELEAENESLEKKNLRLQDENR